MTSDLHILSKSVWFCLSFVFWVEFLQKEMRNSNFIEIVEKFSIKESIVRSKFALVSFGFVCTFWHYYNSSFKFKEFLMILRYI